MASEMMEALELLCQEKHIDQLYLIDRLEQSLAKSYADVLHLPFGARVTIDRATGRVYVYELVPKGEEDPGDRRLHRVRRGRRHASRNLPHRRAARQGRDSRHRAQRRPPADLRGVLRSASATSLPAPCSRPRPTSRSSRSARASRPSCPTSTSAAIPRSSTSALPASATCTTSALRPSSSTSATPTPPSRPCAASASVRSIVVSRTHPDLIRRLFELEVPEVYDGIVEIRSVAREAGVRSKVAVRSQRRPPRPGGRLRRPQGQPRAHRRL